MSSFEQARMGSVVVSYAVNALWQAPLVAAAAWAAARMLRRAGPRAQHVVWVAALIVMVALPAAPRQHWTLHRQTATVTMVADDFDLSTLPPLAPAPQPWWEPELGLATLPRGLMLALLFGYFGAGLYFAARLGWSLWRTHALVRESVAVQFAPEAEAIWQRCRATFGLGEVRWLVSGEIACPVTLGRATLLLPAGFVEDASAEELLTALAHECAHLRRHDFWKNVAYELASLPVVFHPALWAVKRQIAETREMVCDSAAVSLVEPQRYVRSLLRLAGSVVAPPVSSAAMGMFDGRTLERRIAMMKTKHLQMGRMKRIAMLTATAAIAAVVTAGAASLAVSVEAKAAPAEAKAAAESEASASAPPALPQSASAEAAAKLQPPGRTVSKDDYERRVAYAQAHFGAGNTPGEQTDRGVAYIQYGKPDAVDTYPGGGVQERSAEAGGGQTVAYPYEVWHYRRLLGIGDNVAIEFVDQCSCGDYRAAPMQASLAALNAQVASLQPLLAEAKAQQLAISPEQIAHLKAKIAVIQAMKVHPEQMAKLQAQVSKLQAMKISPEQMAKMQAQFATIQAVKVSPERIEELNRAIESLQRELAIQKQLPLFQREVVVKPLPYALAAPAVPGSATEPAAPQAAAPANGPLHISGGIMAGVKLSGDEPVYPPIARAAHVRGTVVLHALISETGAVEKLEVISGPQMLQNAAMAAVRTWTYKPYLLNGEPHAVDTTITVAFTLPAEGGQGANMAPQGPAHIRGGVMAGNKIGGDAVTYPQEAKDAHVQGSVVLHAVVSKEGTIEKLELVSGPEPLQKAAWEAVKTWQYKPYMLNGQPTEVDTTITVNFTMSGDAGRPEAPVGLPPQAAAPGAAKLIWAAAPGAAVPLQSAVYHIGGDVSAPQVIHSVVPEFSEAAKKAKDEGNFKSANVMVSLVVDSQGNPQNVHVTGEPVGLGLDEKAVEAVKQYRFKPAMRNGVPVPVELAIEVDFKVF